MESLYSLRKFVEKYPQKIDSSLNYSFLGGTAVRLVQEESENFDCSDKRRISDFDIISFNLEKYPIHTLNPEIVFGVVDLDRKDLLKFVSSANVFGKDYFYMDPTFLSFSKSCAIDNPREKDFNDIKYLVSTGRIDYNNLSFLFDKTGHLNNSRNIALENFKWFFKESGRGANLKSKLFQTFPLFVNLMSEFSDCDRARQILLNYSEKDSSKTGYAFSSILYNSHAVLRELIDYTEEDKLIFLEDLLYSARKNDYINFDRKINREIIPNLRYSKNKKNVLKTF